MKTIFLSAIAILQCCFLFAQDNNPFNKRGIDYYNSLNLITADVAAGKVKDFSDESISRYSKLIPLQNQANSELAAAVTKTLKAPGYTFAGFVDKLPASAYVKATLPQLLNVKKTDQVTWKRLLTEKTDEVKLAKISDTEKEILLTLIAISYHSGTAQTGRTRNECFIQTNGYSGPVDNSVCIIGAAAAGFYIGFQVCGFWCGLGGAVVGGVLAAVS